MKKYPFWLLVIILIALALRLYHLTYHSLWFDEAVSVHWARQSVPRILEVGFAQVEDRLPPLYYLLLKGWTTLFGFSEFGLRSLSVFLGTLLVPVVAAIAALLFNRRVALMAALLVAVNPFLIWYSQEVRMYAPAVLFGTLTVWACLQMSQPAHRPIALRFTFYVLFSLFALAGLYTHLYTGFLLPALGLWLVISYPRHWQRWGLFAVSGLIITLAYLPLLLATWRFSAEAAPGDPLAGLGQRAWGLLQAFILWKAPLPDWLQIMIPAVVAGFALAAFVSSQRIGERPTSTSSVGLTPSRTGQTPSRTGLTPGRTGLTPGSLSLSKAALSRGAFRILGVGATGRSPLREIPKILDTPLSRPRLPYPRLLVSLLLLTPFAIANLLLLRNYLAFFGERYFIVMTPWLLLLAAVGAGQGGDWVSERLGSIYRLFVIHYALFAMLLALTLLPLPGQWSLPAAKEAWRQSADYLAQHATPADGILIHPDWVRYPFQYYFNGPGQTYAAFSNVGPETALDGPLQGVVNGHPVIWLIQSHLDGPDPQRRVEQWLAARYPLVTEAYPPGISLKGYAPGYQLDTLPPEATPTDIQFANGLRLAGFQADRTVSATDDLFHPPSGWAHVILYWTAAQPVSAEAEPYINLVGPEGVWGASLNRPNDALKLYPPARWPAGQAGRRPYIRQDIDVNLNPATPPGVYRLIVGLSSHDPAQYPLADIQVHR